MPTNSVKTLYNSPIRHTDMLLVTRSISELQLRTCLDGPISRAHPPQMARIISLELLQSSTPPYNNDCKTRLHSQMGLQFSSVSIAMLPVSLLANAVH